MSAPEYDGAEFAKWLRRWKDQDGRFWREIAQAAGLSASTLQLLAKGEQQATRGRGSLSPSAEVLARIAHAFGLEIEYVMSKAGLSDGGSRWAAFSRGERAAIARSLADAEDLTGSKLRAELLQHDTPPTNTGE